MAIAKRIFLFIITNLLVMVTISIILNVLGIGNYITAYGIDYSALMAFCLVWGMGGAFISLLMSKVMAKWMMGVKIIDPNNPGQFREVVEMVRMLSAKASLPMPEVGYFESPEVNAFATGPTKKRSLVAVSTGLLNRMDRDEVEAVLGHEVAHIANGDMVTLTLIQGIVNAFVMFLARVIAYAISTQAKEESQPMIRMFTTIALEICFSILGSMVVSWFSRQREFRADRGGAQYAGKYKMLSALKRLQQTYEIQDPRLNQEAFQSMKISGKGSKFMALLSTHPPLSVRIKALESAQIV